MRRVEEQRKEREAKERQEQKIYLLRGGSKKGVTLKKENYHFLDASEKTALKKVSYCDHAFASSQHMHYIDNRMSFLYNCLIDIYEVLRKIIIVIVFSSWLKLFIHA